MWSVKEEDGMIATPGWLEQVGQRACEWCSAPEWMKQELSNYVDKALSEWPHEWVLDLNNCEDCVLEYYRIKDDLTEWKLKLQKLDLRRLSNVLSEIHYKATDRKPFGPSLHEDSNEIVSKLHVPLLEILRFPYLLHDKELSSLFVSGLITLLKLQCPIMLEEKRPGVYLLLIHSDPEVRGWAVKQVRSLGFITSDDYDLLQEVISWMINEVQFNLVDASTAKNSEYAPLTLRHLPSHLYSYLTVREYWLGLFILIRQFDSTTVQSRFLGSTGHRSILNKTVDVMANCPSDQEENSPFWPTLQCLVVFLERLGSRIWFDFCTFNYTPAKLFLIITQHALYVKAIEQWDCQLQSSKTDDQTPGENDKDCSISLSQDVMENTRHASPSQCTRRLYKTTLAWFQPFVQSLLDFDAGGSCLSDVIGYLHCRAGGSAPGRPLWLEVQAVLLPIINGLLTKATYPLLVPTVRLWASDVVDVAYFVGETTEKVLRLVKSSHRLLHNLLKLVGKCGYKEALYYIPFCLTGQLPAGEKKNIIFLLVQGLESIGKELPQWQYGPWMVCRTSSSMSAYCDKLEMEKKKKELEPTASLGDLTKCSAVKEKGEPCISRVSSILDWAVEPLTDSNAPSIKDTSTTSENYRSSVGSSHCTDTWEVQSTSMRNKHSNDKYVEVNSSLGVDRKQSSKSVKPGERGTQQSNDKLYALAKSRFDGNRQSSGDRHIEGKSSQRENEILDEKQTMEKSSYFANKQLKDEHTTVRPSFAETKSTDKFAMQPWNKLPRTSHQSSSKYASEDKNSGGELADNTSTRPVCSGAVSTKKRDLNKQQIFQPCIVLRDIKNQNTAGLQLNSKQQLIVNKSNRKIITPTIETKSNAEVTKATEKGSISLKRFTARKSAVNSERCRIDPKLHGSSSTDPIVLSDDDEDKGDDYVVNTDSDDDSVSDNDDYGTACYSDKAEDATVQSTEAIYVKREISNEAKLHREVSSCYGDDDSDPDDNISLAQLLGDYTSLLNSPDDYDTRIKQFTDNNAKATSIKKEDTIPDREGLFCSDGMDDVTLRAESLPDLPRKIERDSARRYKPQASSSENAKTKNVFNSIEKKARVKVETNGSNSADGYDDHENDEVALLPTDECDLSQSYSGGKKVLLPPLENSLSARTQVKKEAIESDDDASDKDFFISVFEDVKKPDIPSAEETSHQDEHERDEAENHRNIATTPPDEIFDIDKGPNIFEEFDGSEEVTNSACNMFNQPLNIENKSEICVRDKAAIEDETTEMSLDLISKQMQHTGYFDDGMQFWEGHTVDMIRCSQENALASVEEDLDDVYSAIQNQNARNSPELSTDVVSMETGLQRDDATSSPDPYFDNVEVSAARASVPGQGSSRPQKHVTFQLPPDHKDANQGTSRAGQPVVVHQLHPDMTKPQRPLTEDDFLYELLRWDVQSLTEGRNCGKPGSLPRRLSLKCKALSSVPYSFHSMDHYYDTFKPLLFMEMWQQMVSEWSNKDVNKKTVFVKVDSVCPSNSFKTIQCSGLIDEKQHSKAWFPLESDMVIVRHEMHSYNGGHVSRPVPVFGFVQKAEVKANTSKNVNKESDKEGNCAKGKPQLTLIIQTSHFYPATKSLLQVEFVTSLLTALRQWSGLMYFGKSLLARDLLKPRNSQNFGLNDGKAAAEATENWNLSQDRVISTATAAVHKPYPIPRICLVQGPPGTGKSHTIVGLVKNILDTQSTENTQGPGVLSTKFRILLCAPSNAAVDELIRRLAEANICLNRRHDGKENRQVQRQRKVRQETIKNCGDLCVVRVGRKSHIHPAVQRFSVDNMARQELDARGLVDAGQVSVIREKLKEIHAEEKSLEEQIMMLIDRCGPRQGGTELENLRSKKAELTFKKRELEKKRFTEREDRRRQEVRIRRNILAGADIICTTLSGSGSRSLKQDLSGSTGNKIPFGCVIVDEACQSNELDLLIPLSFRPSKLILVGDPEQLPATVLSTKAKEKLFGRSMFERLYRFFRKHKEMEKPVLMLEEQYRMHPEIAAFPSQHVYNSRLRSHSSLEGRRFPLKKHYALFDVVRGQEICQERGEMWNETEADLVAQMCVELTQYLSVDCFGIITPYKKQKAEIQRRLADSSITKGEVTVEVNTVDGFQGREKDVIILSCVRAKNYRGSIGFVSDRQRMNVALTRARHALYVFGHMETLKGGSRDWEALIVNAERRGCLHSVRRYENIHDVVFSTLFGEGRSPAKDPRLKSNISQGQEKIDEGNTLCVVGSIRKGPQCTRSDGLARDLSAVNDRNQPRSSRDSKEIKSKQGTAEKPCSDQQTGWSSNDVELPFSGTLSAGKGDRGLERVEKRSISSQHDDEVKRKKLCAHQNHGNHQGTMGALNNRAHLHNDRTFQRDLLHDPHGELRTSRSVEPHSKRMVHSEQWVRNSTSGRYKELHRSFSVVPTIPLRFEERKHGTQLGTRLHRSLSGPISDRTPHETCTWKTQHLVAGTHQLPSSSDVCRDTNLKALSSGDQKEGTRKRPRSDDFPAFVARAAPVCQSSQVSERQPHDMGRWEQSDARSAAAISEKERLALVSSSRPSTSANDGTGLNVRTLPRDSISRRSPNFLHDVDPLAREAIQVVRERYRPVQGPKIIEPTSELLRWNPHGGSRRRLANVGGGNAQVQRLRERANEEVNVPPTRTKRASQGRGNLKLRDRIRNSWK